MDIKRSDNKAFTPIGFSFLAIGIVFLKKTPGIGIAFIALGISWIVIGKTKNKKNKEESGK